VQFDDATPPLALQDGRRRPPAGPVLVRAVSTSEGSYRTAPRSVAVDVVIGDRRSLCLIELAAAALRLRWACIGLPLGFVLGGLLALFRPVFV
jgi:hypothetical protein